MTEEKSPRMGAMFGGNDIRGFLDLPQVESDQVADADIMVVGVPIATSYISVGAYCESAPDAVRAAFGWPGVLDHHDFDLGGKIMADGVNAVDCGNLPCSASDFEHNRKLIHTQVAKLLDQGAVPLVMGGDDSTPIPVLQAFEVHGPITVVQFDAHIDWRDEVAGERMGLSSNMRRASEMSWVENIIQIGARGQGSARPSDYEDALEWGVKFFPMKDVQTLQDETIVKAIPKGSRVFINLDIDAMDPAVVPSVIGPAPGGFSYWRMVNLISGIAERATIAGFSLVELMPDNDVGGRGALVAARILANVLGLTSRQVANKKNQG